LSECGRSSGGANHATASESRRSVVRRTLVSIAAVLLVVVSAVAIWWWRQPLAAYAFDKYTMSPLTETGNVSLAALSPDGKYLAYTDDESGKQSLWLEQLATSSTVRVLGPLSGLLPGLRFTPDGNYIYFSQSD